MAVSGSWVRVGAALLLLVAVAGCREAAEPTLSEEPVQEVDCDDEGRLVTPGGRGEVWVGGCANKAVLASVNEAVTDPTTWIAQDEFFEGHLVEKVQVPAPPEGQWRWEADSSGFAPGTTWYWIENLKVEASGERRDLENWMIPLSHFACTQLPNLETIGELMCQITVDRKSTTEQISRSSWGILTSVEGGTPKWVPLAEGKAGAELALQFKAAISRGTDAAESETRTLILPAGATDYVFAVQEFRRYETPITLKGQLCSQTNREQPKECSDGWQQNANVYSTNQTKTKTYHGQIPEAKETELRKHEPVRFQRGLDRGEPPWAINRYSFTYRAMNQVEDEGKIKVFAEGRLAGYQGRVEGDAALSNLDSKGTEVVYHYELHVKHAPQNHDEIKLWLGYSGFKMGDTVSEGPVFLPHESMYEEGTP